MHRNQPYSAAVKPMRRRLAGWLLLAMLALLAAAPAQAQERILKFDSRIIVAADGSLTVTENIRARVRGAGIQRDIPTRGLEFRLIGTERNGWPEPARIEEITNGVRIHLGQEGGKPLRGPQTWMIRYRVIGQFGFFETSDAISWNVTGYGWQMPIDTVSARIELPRAVPKDQLVAEGSAGPQDIAGTNWRAVLADDGTALYSTTKPLKAGEGLSALLRFPKGLVRAPAPPRAPAAKKVEDPRPARKPGDRRTGILLAFAGLALAALCHLLFWFKLGRDPAPIKVVPCFEPPQGHSPGELRQLWLSQYDARCFLADTVSLAIAGSLAFEREFQGDNWSLRPRRMGPPATDAAAALLSTLMPPGAGALRIGAESAPRLREAMAAHETAIGQRAEQRLQAGNTGAWLIGLLLSAIAMLVALGNADPAGGLLVAILFYFGPWIYLHWQSGALLQRLRQLSVSKEREPLQQFKGLATAATAAVAALAALLLWTQVDSLAFLAAAMGTVALNLVFRFLMPARSRTGVELLAAAKGLQLYLNISEPRRLTQLGAPELTPGRYLQLLPFAIALEAEEDFGKQLLAAVGEKGVQDLRGAGALPDAAAARRLAKLIESAT